MTQRNDLMAERSFLAARLAQLPASARLTRHRAQARLQRIDQLRGALPTEAHAARRVRLTFPGSPCGEAMGRVAAAVEHPEVVNAHLDEPVTVHLVQTTVGGARPRYVLTALPEDGFH